MSRRDRRHRLIYRPVEHNAHFCLGGGVCEAIDRYFAAVVAACADWPGFMNLTNTRWPMRKGASSAETTTSTTRSSLASLAASDFSLRAPKVAAMRMTWPVETLLGSASGT